MAKKVGIVSCYFKNNYGSMLQAYATKRILDNNNIPNETINIDGNKDFSNGKKKYYLSQAFNFNFIKSKLGMIKMKFDTKLNKKLGENVAVRNKKYKEFRKEFNLSRTSNTYDDLTKLSKERYSDILLGSDQLWLPVNVVADYYTLNWVPNDINKISFSTSFGVSTIPNKYNNLYKQFLKRINHLSVREDTGVKLIKEIAGLDAKLVCDPTILLTREEWEEVASKERIIEDKYILCYFLGNNIEHRKFAERLREKTGYKIVSLNHADEYVKYSDVFCDIAPYDIGPREWINLVKNAEYVCTDSFHGTVFSLLFNKIFFNFRRYNAKAKAGTNSRLDSLLNMVGISSERILSGNENIDDVLKYKIDFDVVNNNLEKVRNDSKKWLLDSLSYKEESECKYIKIDDKSMCSGCTACKNKCPKGAIEMIRDSEGFLYPKVDENKCVNCGLCKNSCPILNKTKNSEFNQKGYIFQYSDKKIRKQSTSGGAFTAIADYVIDNNGVVFGAAFDEKLSVKHVYVDNKKDLVIFRNSKYVQSDPNVTFKDVEKFLKEGRLVCYSGTTCQIEGLLSFLGKKYDNLLTVDVICRAVPSPLLWEKYLKSKKINNDVNKAFFREKKYGYKYSNLTMYSDDKLIYNNGIDSDPYLRAFFSNIACRPSCYECKFKSRYHKSDFTIWDCFEVSNFDDSFDDDMGTTRVLINTNKAESIFECIRRKHKCKEIDPEKLISNFHQMFNSVSYNSKRDEFFEDLNKLEINDVMKKYFPNNFKCIIEKYLRLFLIKIKLYKPILKIGKKIRRRN